MVGLMSCGPQMARRSPLESKGLSGGRRASLMREPTQRNKLTRLRGFPLGSSEMCDYSLHNVKSRPAKVGDKLTTRNFGTGTRGFAASEDANVAVCVLPGTELSFSDEVACEPTDFFGWRKKVMKYTTAVNKPALH